MDAIPLAPRANLEQYRKLAKELLVAWRSTDEDAVRVWGKRWFENLAKVFGVPFGFIFPKGTVQGSRTIYDEAERVVVLVRDEAKSKAALADAQYVLARLHAFESWPLFVKHLRALQRAFTEDAQFEAAAEAVVTGDLARLRELLATRPALIHARSSRSHRAPLLHYVAANGIEDFRQRTPPNIVSVARFLIDAGAEVDAVSGDHGDETALALVATSMHPRDAGVQTALMELLVAAGADVNGVRGRWQSIMHAALANGCPEAAEWLAAHGAQMDAVAAACFGRVEVLERCLAAGGVTSVEREEAFVRACGCGRTAAACLLLDRGVDIGALHGQTGLHLATHSAHLETVLFLLSRKAPLEVKNRYGGTVLDQALWSAVHNRDVDYVPIIEALLGAGAVVDPSWSTGIDAIDILLRGSIRKS